MYEEVHIVHYPDPVLREKCAVFRDGDLAGPDRREELAALVKRMGQVLLEERGVVTGWSAKADVLVRRDLTESEK